MPTPDTTLSTTLDIECAFYIEVYNKNRLILNSDRNLYISYKSSPYTELVLRFTSTESILSIFDSVGEFSISEEGGSEKVFKVQKDGTVDFKSDICFPYRVFIVDRMPYEVTNEGCFYDAFLYFNKNTNSC